jgi:DNA integrity scanning protein DisA with diadenylate cyclase activity
MIQQADWSPRAEGIMRMAKILAWLQIDPDAEIDTVWSCLREKTKKRYAKQASMVLQLWSEGGTRNE